MKKLILLFLTIFISIAGIAQLNIGVSVGKTLDVYTGFTIENIRAEYSYILPYSSTVKVHANIISLGYNFILTNKDIDTEDNISQIVFTPIIGASFYSYKNYDKITEKIDDKVFLYGSEIAIRQFGMEFFLTVKQYQRFTYGIGLRALIGNHRFN